MVRGRNRDRLTAPLARFLPLYVHTYCVGSLRAWTAGDINDHHGKQPDVQSRTGRVESVDGSSINIAQTHPWSLRSAGPLILLRQRQGAGHSVQRRFIEGFASSLPAAARTNNKTIRTGGRKVDWNGQLQGVAGTTFDSKRRYSILHHSASGIYTCPKRLAYRE